ncbi:HIRAN domain-containing protein [Enterococcus sp. CSURQ0835]|uniref:HIRAN domain-containing protein n=1 Tax=Enterococcus sp. CSURQ0835 TaxID=2681394 RepID=UPI00135C5212|nr:HIRAN domain-containing protein [Enterococcus sp. CSURQ0835]
MEKKLYLLWQDRKTRCWYHVGTLFQHQDQTFSFAYEHGQEKSLQAAIAAGYAGHPAFPDLTKTYHATKLFSAFNRRLPNRRRKDYHFLFEIFDQEKKQGNFDLLAITGGRLYGDAYEFVEPIYEKENRFEIDCFLRGWRHYNNETATLENAQLMLVKEEKNLYDQDAVFVFDQTQNKKIGYIPAFYSTFVRTILDADVAIKLEYQFYKNAESHYKVRLNLTGRIPAQLNYTLKNELLLS